MSKNHKGRVAVATTILFKLGMTHAQVMVSGFPLAMVKGTQR
jgi:hypothetical protein